MNKFKNNTEGRGKVTLYSAVKFLLLAIALFIGGVATHATLINSEQVSPIKDNPFAAFANVFPGQAAEAPQANGFECQLLKDYPEYPDSYNPSASRCILEAASNTFTQITAFTSEGAIQLTYFEPNTGKLKVAQLIDLWGEPEVRELSQFTYLTWRKQHIFAMALNQSSCNQDSYTSLELWRVYMDIN